MQVNKIKSDNDNQIYTFITELINNNIDIKILHNSNIWIPNTTTNQLTIESKPVNRQEQWNNYSQLLLNSLQISNIVNKSSFEYEIIENHSVNQLIIRIKEKILNSSSKILLIKFECINFNNKTDNYLIYNNVIDHLYNVISSKDSIINRLNLTNHTTNYQVNELQYIVDTYNQEKEKTINELLMSCLLLLNSKKRKIESLTKQLSIQSTGQLTNDQSTNLSDSESNIIPAVETNKPIKEKAVKSKVTKKQSGVKLLSTRRSNTSVLQTKDNAIEIESDSINDILANSVTSEVNDDIMVDNYITNDQKYGITKSNIAVDTNYPFESNSTDPQSYSQINTLNTDISGTITSQFDPMIIESNNDTKEYQIINTKEDSLASVPSSQPSVTNATISSNSNSMYKRKKPSLLDTLTDCND